MKTEIKKVDGKNHLFLIFNNGQSFRINTDRDKKHTQSMLNLAIDYAKLDIESKILKEQDQDLGHLGLKIMYKHI